jgi:hypothetical protein
MHVPQKLFLGEAAVKSKNGTEAGAKRMRIVVKSLPDRPISFPKLGSLNQ